MSLMSICLVLVFARFIHHSEAIEKLVESKVTVPFFVEVVAGRMTPLAQPFHSLMECCCLYRLFWKMFRVLRWCLQEEV